MNTNPSTNEVRRNDELPAVIRFKEIVQQVIDEQRRANQDPSSTLATRILELECDIAYEEPFGPARWEHLFDSLYPADVWQLSSLEAKGVVSFIEMRPSMPFLRVVLLLYASEEEPQLSAADSEQA